MHKLANNTLCSAKSRATNPEKRGYEECILLAVCLAGMLGVVPFAVLRFISSDWLMGSVDAVIVLSFILIGIYIWKSRNIRIPGIFLSTFYLIIMVAVVYINGSSVIYWAFPTMTAAYFLLKPGEAVTANVIAMFAIIPVLSINIELLEFMSILVTLILNNMFSYIFSRNMHGRQEKLATQATRDSLTGVGNRRLFDENVSESIAFLKRNKEVTSLVMLDLDHFKKINDTFGHVMGDEVLVQLMDLFKSRLRESDGLYRVGGEEFAILLRRTSAKVAVRIAEELRCLVEKNIPIPYGSVTISLGVAECVLTDSSKTWLERADSALYKAKNTGRNRTCAENGEQVTMPMAKLGF